MTNLNEIATGIGLSGEGIWFSSAAASVSYPASGNESCFRIEENSFWFKHRNRCLVETIRRFPPSGAVFDIGGGNGYVALAIQESGFDVVVVEPGPDGARNARRRGIRSVICATVENAGFLDRSMAAAGLFDVLEHIEDDLGFLKSLARRLLAGGRLYLTVPAFSALWSQEDNDAGHYRRYTLRQLRNVLERAGLEAEYLTYFFAFLPAPILLSRALPYRLGIRRRRAGEADHRALAGMIGSLLEGSLHRELARIRAGRKVVLGGSCLAVARVR